MNKKQLNETLQNINDLATRLNSLMDEQIKVVNQLPPEEKAKLNFVNTEIEMIKKGIREGNLSSLEQMLKRYADSNTKH